MGHTCSLWLDDPTGLHARQGDALVRQNVDEWFGPIAAPVHKGFPAWRGADVAVATGWQTVDRTLLLERVRARAYLVQDHEPEFYATSVERVLAERTYSQGLYIVAASSWLADLVRARYGARATSFELGVDGAIYHPVAAVARRLDTVLFYSRPATPRRATSLGWLALTELRRRRPDLRVVAFGDRTISDEPPFDHEHAGIVDPRQLAALYSQGTVGLVLSMTNYSLIPQEMLACGLPCVDLLGGCSEAVFGSDGPVALTAFDPVAVADAVEGLLGESDEWRRRSQAGLDWSRGRTWSRAAHAFERGLRQALAEREAQVHV
jgi:glycosyltransferase involved in cell wall biosynthesis